MTVPVWPIDELPSYILVDGFGRTQPDGRLRSQTDTGPGKMRLVNSAAVAPATIEVYLDPNQTARFRRFWAEDTGGGVLPFLIRDPQFDGLLLADEDGVLLTDENDVVLAMDAWWLVQFDGAPRETQVAGMLSKLQCGLLILP